MVNNNNNNILPYFKKNTSALLVLSAIALLLLASSVLLPSNTLLLLQPAQATTIFPTSMQTQNPVKLERSCSAANATLTFEAKGNGETLTNGTFQIINSSNSGQTLWSGDLFRAYSLEGNILLAYGAHENVPVCGIGSGDGLQIRTDCGNNNIRLSTDDTDFILVPALVDCEFPRDTTTAQQPSPPTSPVTGTTTTTKDSDSDGIPDSSDRCPHNSYHRCFKEADTSSTTSSSASSTQQEQQPSSSSSGNGNQTG